MAPPSLKLVVSGLFPGFFFLTHNRHKIWSLIPMSLLIPLLGHLRHHPLLVSLLSHKLYLFCLLSWFFFIILSFKYCIDSGSGSHISSLLYSSSSPLTLLVIPSRLGALNSIYTEMVLKRRPPPPTLSWLPTASDQQKCSLMKCSGLHPLSCFCLINSCSLWISAQVLLPTPPGRDPGLMHYSPCVLYYNCSFN